MATGVIVYEDDRYLLRMLMERIKEVLGYAYVVDGNDAEQTKDVIRFCEECIVCYDVRQYGEVFRSRSDAIPLFEKGVLDIGKTIQPFSIDLQSRPVDAKKGEMTILLPFVYPEEREEFIKSNLAYLQDCEVCLRIDYLPKIKCSSCVEGALSSLLKAASRKKFKPSQIMDYCVLDNDGFFTPGPLSSDDDIMDYSREDLSCLLRKTKSLINDKDKEVSSLVVAEGLRTDKLASLVQYADRIIILLPDKAAQNRPGMCELIAQISRASNGVDVEIRILNNGIEKYEEAI